MNNQLARQSSWARQSHSAKSQGHAWRRYAGALAGTALICVGIVCLFQEFNIHFLAQFFIMLVDLVLAVFWPTLLILLGLVVLLLGALGGQRSTPGGR